MATIAFLNRTVSVSFESFQRLLFTQCNEVHTQNETMASGTIFAISYVSDLKEVTKENLVVFTVLPKYSPFTISFFLHLT